MLVEKNRTNDYVLDEKNKETKKKKKEKKHRIKTKITELIPITDTASSGCFKLKEDKYFDILQIQSKDVMGSSFEGVTKDVSDLSRIYRSYNEDMKIVSMTFPVNAATQLEYHKKLLNGCENDIYKKMLLEKINELKYLENNHYNREYYLFIYGENEYDLKKTISNTSRHFASVAPLIELDAEKKIKILNKLYNMNSKIDMQ